MSKLICGTFDVTPTGWIIVSGADAGGRTHEIHLTPEEVERLRKVFEFSRLLETSLGHANWHVENGVWAKCESC